MDGMIRRPLAFWCGAFVVGMALEFVFQIGVFVLCLVLILALMTTKRWPLLQTLLQLKLLQNLMHKQMLNKRETISMPDVQRGIFKHRKHKDLNVLYVCIIVAIVGAIIFKSAWEDMGVLCQFEHKYLKAEGIVLEAEDKGEGKYNLVVKVDVVENYGELPEGEKILVRVYENLEDYYTLPGKRVSIQGMVELPKPRTNPKLFDYRVYLMTLKIHTIMEALPSNITVINETRYLDIDVQETADLILNEHAGPNIFMKGYYHYLGWIAKVKYAFIQNLNFLPDSQLAALVSGMVLGDSNMLDDSVYEKFQKNGICHILAVSGLHVGTLYACVRMIIGGRKGKLVNIIVLLCLFFYCTLAGFSPSVVRASVMIGVHVIGDSLLKRYDMLTACLLTMVCMLLVNPIMILNLGFQLSYIAIITLAVVMPAFMRMCNHGAVAAIVIQLGIAPNSAYTFNYFSFVAILANVPALFIGGILIPLGMLMLLISLAAMYLQSIVFMVPVLEFLFKITSICVEFFGELLMFLNDVAFLGGNGYMHVTSPKLWMLFVYYALLAFLCSETFRLFFQRRMWKRIVVVLVAIFVGCGCTEYCLKDGFEKSNLVFLDVGQGDCLFVRTDKGEVVMIDSGGSATYDVGEEVLLPFCLKNGIDHIDTAVITHFHTDHCKGLESLARLIPVEKLVIYEGNSVVASAVSEQMGCPAEDFVYMAAGDVLQIDDDLVIEALAPERLTHQQYEAVMSNQKDENDASLIVKLCIEGVTVMMTGDIDTEGEATLLDLYVAESNKLQCDILKVAHHGSKYGTSQAFLDAVNPKLAVIQVGKNNYGHPNADTLKRLERMNVSTYRNDLHGAIGIEIEDGVLDIRTMVKAE